MTDEVSPKVKTHFEDTSTRIGLFRLARCSLSTLVVIVAENRNVFRSFGITFRILSMIGPKSMSSSLSASSITYNSQLGACKELSTGLLNI